MKLNLFGWKSDFGPALFQSINPLFIVVNNHKLIICALNAFGANLTAALLPVGDRHNSPITQIIYDKMTQLTLICEAPAE